MPEHVSEVISKSHANAVTIASMLHYDFIQNQKSEVDNSVEGNIEFLSSGKSFGKITSTNLQDIKAHLTEVGIACRYHEMAEAKT